MSACYNMCKIKLNPWIYNFNVVIYYTCFKDKLEKYERFIFFPFGFYFIY